MHEIICSDCGKHIGWFDPMDNVGIDAYCDGCAILKGAYDEIDDSTNNIYHSHQ
jgi:hypothetical protein